MNRRQRFLDVLRSVTGSTAFTGIAPERTRKTTRLRLESLEERRVMAVAVTDFDATDTGFVVEFSEAIDPSSLNLYDTESGAMGAADVTLTGASTGAVEGSLVVDGSSIIFVATSGLLPADTYTVVLRSAANGIKSLDDGELLDGETNASLPSGNGTPGGNFTTSFTVSANSNLVVSIPDFARGPSQAAQAPASGAGATLPAGLPIQLSNASGVTSMTVTLEYDPALLNITDVELGEDAPDGSQVEVNLTTPGTVTFAFFSLDPMPAGAASVVELIGNVPANAAYGRAHVVRMTSVNINAGAIAARANDALHVVAYTGDVNANRRYDAEDARLIARVGVGLDSGFVTTTPTSTTIAQALFPLIDPIIIGDVTGAGGISPLDSSDVLRKVVGLSVPNLPDLPTSQAPTAIALSNQVLTGSSIASGTTVGTLSTTDPTANDTFTYSLATGTGATNNSLFSISGNALRTAGTLTPSSSPYSVRVRTTDSSGNTLEQVFSITVNATNTAPTALNLSASSFAESTTSGTTIATLSSVDANSGDTFTYSLVSGTGSTDNASFTVTGNQLILNTTPDFETKPSYSIRLRTTDSGGLTFERAVTLTVTNSNEAPTAIAISSTSVTRGAAIGTVVGTLSTTDPDAADTHVYSLVTGTGATDNASFSISVNQLLTAVSFSGATQNSYSIRVRSTDAAGATTERVITGSIVNNNTAPTAINLSASSFAESTTSGSVIATLSSVDANAGDTFTYSVVSGEGATDNAAFTISGNQLLLNTTPDFETKSSYNIRLRTTDAGGLSFERAVTLSVTNSNDSPTAIAISATNVLGNVSSGAVVGILSTTDQDAADTHVYSLVTGTGSTDNASFTISGNQLQTAVAFNPATQSSYSIRIRSTDSAGAFVERIVTGNVVNGNVAPTAINLSATSFAENTASGTTVATLSSVDANTSETFTYSLVTGEGSADNVAFTISGNGLVLNTTPDFETKSSYNVRLRTTDSGGLNFERAVVLNVTNSNDTPTALSITATNITAGAAIGTVVGSLSTTDQDLGDTHVYSLVTGDGSTNNTQFTISGNQLLTAVVFNAGTQSSYSVRVRSTDSAGAFVEQIMTGNVVQGNSAPTAISLSNSLVAENAATNAVVGTLSTTDANAGDTHTYALVSGDGDADNAAFVIDGNSLRTTMSFDFENKASYDIRVRSTDAAGASVEQEFTISVTNVNESPTNLALDNTTIENGDPSGTIVGVLQSSDPDAADTFTYELVAGDGDVNNASFTISGSQLVTNFTANVATKSSYSARVKTTDAGGLSIERALTITVVDVNVAPTGVALSSSTIPENSPAGTTIGTLSTTDANVGDSHVYSLVPGEGGTNNSSFQIVNNELRSTVPFNFESQSSYTVRVRSTDAGGLFFEQVLTVSVGNVDEPPTDITLSANTIPENSPVGTVIGTLTTSDPEASDQHTYMLVAGEGANDNAKFSIVGNQLRVAGTLDFEQQTTYSIRVQAEDQTGLLFEEVFAIAVTNINESATTISLSSLELIEGAASGTVVGTLSANDPDSSDQLTFELVSGEGDTNNSSFSISGNQLTANFVPNRATQNTYLIRVRVTDAGGLSAESVIPMIVIEQPFAPTDIALSNATIAENIAIGTTVGTLTTTDANTSDSHVYSLVTGNGDTDNAMFSINGGLLVTASNINFESKPTLSVRVRSTDANDLFFEKVFVITVTNVNEPPTNLSLSKSTIADLQNSGALVGLINTMDPDAADTFSYSFVAGEGDTDNTKFQIVDGRLLTALSVDAAVQSMYSLRIRSTDAGGLSVDRMLEVLVSEANQAPTAIVLTPFSVPENLSVGSVIGTLTTTDENELDVHTYRLVAGTGDADNGMFTIQGNQLILASPLDFDSQSSLTIRIISEDPYGLSVEQILEVRVQEVLG